MKKFLSVVASIIILILVINFVDIQYNQLPQVILKNNLTAYVSEEVTNLSFISEVKNGSIVSKEEKIDTSTIGKKQVVITIKNKYGKKRDYRYFITIIE